ncbi:hypothetical protein BDB01DRAFT_890075 [Pilobolus umbonatus]|nr:hypothetical protein BDB01DRAFT_890075 [Pilobolus umbonatus]
MDLSWCIICDNKVGESLNESLYCSESCKLKDQMTSITNQLVMNQPKKLANKPTLSTSTILRTKRSTAPSTSYPWIPLYRRKRGVVITKRCQPIVASSFTTANALFSSTAASNTTAV